MKVALTTLGCKVNHYETEVMRELFVQDGWEIVEFSDLADVYVINTCTVTQTSDSKSRQMIARAHRSNPNALVVAVGCYAQVSPEIVSALGPFDLDPCSPVNRPWPTAAQHFTVRDDGLAQAWHGRVWCNPPFGR